MNVISSYDSDKSIFDFLKKSFLLITTGSTAAIDAMVMGVPVITFNADSFQRISNEFINFGATYHAKNKNEVNNLIRKLISENFDRTVELKTQDFLNEYFRATLNSGNLFKDSSSGSLLLWNSISKNFFNFSGDLFLNSIVSILFRCLNNAMKPVKKPTAQVNHLNNAMKPVKKVNARRPESGCSSWATGDGWARTIRRSAPRAWPRRRLSFERTSWDPARRIPRRATTLRLARSSG